VRGSVTVFKKITLAERKTHLEYKCLGLSVPAEGKLGTGVQRKTDETGNRRNTQERRTIKILGRKNC